MDRFLPETDELVAEQALVSAGAERTFAAIDSAEVSGDRLFATLGGLADLAERLGGDVVRPRRLGQLLGPELGFVPLASEPASVHAVGLVARYSPFDRGVERVDPARFAGYAQPGRVKAVLVFSLRPQGGERTLLDCEVRVRATDDDTRSALGTAWFLLGPGLRLLVRRLLDLVRREAESSPQRGEATSADRGGE